MAPIRHDGDQQHWVDNYGSHVDQVIREAQRRGEFDHLPGMGRPLKLEDESVYGAEWQSAYRVAKNAGAAPLWVELEKDVRTASEALRAMLERTAQHLTAASVQVMQSAELSDAEKRSTVDRAFAGAAATCSSHSTRRRWWPFGRAQARPATRQPERLASPLTLADLEAQRQRARRLYLARAAELDKKIQEYNAHRPRELSWLEKPRLPLQRAAQQFDAVCPPLATTAAAGTPTGEHPL